MKFTSIGERNEKMVMCSGGTTRTILNTEQNMLALARHTGIQTAVSAATFGGSTAVSVGMGGKLSDQVFLSGALTNAGSATGGVVSLTFR